MSDVSRRRKITTTSIHIMALDGIVNVNSLFTLALFLGITSTNTTTTLVGAAACIAEPSVAEGLITYHVYSFSCFLFSSLIALALKQAINISQGTEESDAGAGVNGVRRDLLLSFVGKVDTLALRMGILVSGFGSVFGCAFLVMALVDLVQIKLGTLACGSHYTFAAVTPLLFLVPIALMIYILLVLYAFAR